MLMLNSTIVRMLQGWKHGIEVSMLLVCRRLDEQEGKHVGPVVFCSFTLVEHA